MANIKAAKKRVLISEEERKINAAKKSRIKTAIKKYNAALAAADYEAASKLLRECESLINAAKSDGVYQANTAARKISALARALAPLKAKYDAENAAKTAAEPAKKTKKAAKPE